MSQVKHDDTERKVTGGDPAETTRPHHEAGSGDRGGWDDWVDVEGGVCWRGRGQDGQHTAGGVWCRGRWENGCKCFKLVSI